MRFRVTILFIGQLASLGLLAPAWADTIHLKNGRTIVADHVRENGNHYEYDLGGDDSYAIPKSVVDHVDAGPQLAPTGSGATKIAELPSFTPADSLAMKVISVGKIIKEGKVDTDVLAALENKGDAELSATADFIAGKFEFDHGNVTQRSAIFRQRSSLPARQLHDSHLLRGLAGSHRQRLPRLFTTLSGP